MVHRAAFEVNAVVEYLLRKFPAVDIHTLLQPLARLIALEAGTSKYQRLRVREQMVRKKMVFEAAAQRAHLLANRSGHRLGIVLRERLSSRQPLDPVNDAERDRIWFPPIA